MPLILKSVKKKHKEYIPLSIEVLKNLTPDECVGLAKHLYPDLDWKYQEAAELWDGHDVVAWKDNAPYDDEQYILQIDYRSDVTSEQARIRFYNFSELKGTPDIIDIVGYFNKLNILS